MSYVPGWEYLPDQVEAIRQLQPFPTFGSTPANVAGDIPDHVFLWEADRKVLGSVLPPKNQGQVGSCFPADTRIRMKDGSNKRIDQIKLNDEVLTAEGNTGRVRHLFVRYEPECLIRIKCHGHYGIAATGEHPVLTKRGYVRMDRLRIGDLVAVPRYIPKSSMTIQTANHRHWSTRVHKEGKQCIYNGMVSHGKKTAVVQIAPMPDVVTMTKGVGRILGLFLAEGSTDKNKVVWTFHRNETETLVADLITLLRDELGAEAHIQHRGRANTVKVNLHGRGWSELFESLCGNGSGMKRPHPDISSGPEEFLKELYQGWLDGDGHERDNQVQGTTVSRDLALGMFDIANALGMQPAIRYCDPKASHGVKRRLRRYDVVVSVGGGVNRPPIDDTHQWRKVTSILAEPYQGDVFNFEVEGDNSYVAEGIGVHNCVSFGTNTAIRRTMLTEIMMGEAEEFKDIVEEVTYGGSRVEIGKGRISGDGSVGAWAAEFVKQWGVVARAKYGNYDLSSYSESRCREFGRSGVPSDIETVAKLHPVKSITQINSWDEAKKALASGYGIAICSNQGFSMKRDAKGICRPSGSWAHCMALDGYMIENGKEYGHIENSWGPDSHTGPVGWGDPNTAGFWTDAETIDRMLKQDDSWAFSAVEGFPARKINWLL